MDMYPWTFSSKGEACAGYGPMDESVKSLLSKLMPIEYGCHRNNNKRKSRAII